MARAAMLGADDDDDRPFQPWHCRQLVVVVDPCGGAMARLVTP
jgi:hypothetical protein